MPKTGGLLLSFLVAPGAPDVSNLSDGFGSEFIARSRFPGDRFDAKVTGDPKSVGSSGLPEGLAGQQPAIFSLNAGR